jgi:hypothetical protein
LTEDHALNPPGRIKKFSDPSLSVDHNGMAAHLTSLYVIVKGIKKCCISSALDETDDDMLWNVSDEEHVRS